MISCVIRGRDGDAGGAPGRERSPARAAGAAYRAGGRVPMGEQDQSMFKASATRRAHVPAAPPKPAATDDPDRRTLVYLLNFLLAGFERIPGKRPAPTSPPAEGLDQWEDEEYLYLETTIPGEASGLELDLNVFNGVIYARIRHRREDQGVEGASAAGGDVGAACGP